MVKNKSLSYLERLAKLGMTTLETRRLRSNLIEVFKIFKDSYLLTTFNCKVLVYVVIRIPLFKPQVRLDVRKYSFARVIDIWNSLP